MICADCGREVKRVCRDCQARRARDGMLLHQRRFLQTWKAGGIELRVRWYEGTLHLELFDDRWHSYCGIAMFIHGPANLVEQAMALARRRAAALPDDLCPECHKIFDELVARFT